MKAKRFCALVPTWRMTCCPSPPFMIDCILICHSDTLWLLPLFASHLCHCSTSSSSSFFLSTQLPFGEGLFHFYPQDTSKRRSKRSTRSRQRLQKDRRVSRHTEMHTERSAHCVSCIHVPTAACSRLFWGCLCKSQWGVTAYVLDASCREKLAHCVIHIFQQYLILWLSVLQTVVSQDLQIHIKTVCYRLRQTGLCWTVWVVSVTVLNDVRCADWTQEIIFSRTRFPSTIFEIKWNIVNLCVEEKSVKHK